MGLDLTLTLTLPGTSTNPNPFRYLQELLLLSSMDQSTSRVLHLFLNVIERRPAESFEREESSQTRMERIRMERIRMERINDSERVNCIMCSVGICSIGLGSGLNLERGTSLILKSLTLSHLFQPSGLTTAIKLDLRLYLELRF